MRIVYRRGRVVVVAALLSVAAGARVYLGEVRPAERELAAERAALAGLRGELRRARGDAVRLGIPGMEAAIAAARAAVARHEVRVPPTPASGVDAAPEVERWMVAQAARWGVETGERAPLPGEAEGAFLRHGLCVKAVGPYPALGAFLAATLRQPRLVRIRSLRLEAAPDPALVAEMRGELTGAPGGALLAGGGEAGEVRSAPRCGSDRVEVPAGTPPLRAVAVFELVWFTRGGGAPRGVDSLPGAPGTEAGLPALPGAPS